MMRTTMVGIFSNTAIGTNIWMTSVTKERTIRFGCFPIHFLSKAEQVAPNESYRRFTPLVSLMRLLAGSRLTKHDRAYPRINFTDAFVSY